MSADREEQGEQLGRIARALLAMDAESRRLAMPALIRLLQGRISFEGPRAVPFERPVHERGDRPRGARRGVRGARKKDSRETPGL